VTRAITEDTGPASNTVNNSIFHIYPERKCHKCIAPVIDSSKERRSGPTIKQQHAERKEKNERKKSGLPPVEPDDNAFFLHRPYLALHVPPRVLYMGSSKYTAKPAVLIHTGCFWKEYKLQLGPSIAKPGVLDPRGVVAWKHNGGDKKALKTDDCKLKGYKVRSWRLWGEHGKAYVHSVKKARETGKGAVPDVLGDEEVLHSEAEKADEVVYLQWTNPWSRHTRQYHFEYAGIDFYWKGTGMTKESRKLGMLLRFNHLKLVAKLPGNGKDVEQSRPEVCLGKFTSSIAKQKNGSLNLFDSVILQMLEEHAPLVLASGTLQDEVVGGDGFAVEGELAKIARMKRSTMYQLIVATAMCMIIGEKEKRHTLMDLILQAAEGGGGAGG
jgi:hypothetical protein